MFSGLNKDTMLLGVLVFIWSEYLWELYLSVRQYRVASKTKDRPRALLDIMNKETFDKSRLYALDRLRFGFFKDAFGIIITTLSLYYGIMAQLWYIVEDMDLHEGEVAVSCMWLFLLTTIQTIIDLPLTIYDTFYLEAKYGFNKQTPFFFAWDRFKWYILNQVLALPVTSVIILIIKYSGEYFFFWLWLAVGCISLILVTIYPSFIAPIFDKYTPLEEGELRTKIENLASQLDFPLKKLYVVEGSKRSSHSNAYFYGFFKNKRIVLFDTLMKNPDSGGCTDEEILAVLSHELGHWQYGHTAKNLIIMQVNLFLMFLVFSCTFKSPLIYRCVGFRTGLQPVIVGLLVTLQIVMMPYNAIVQYAMTCLTRRFEFQADAFALKLGYSKPLTSALAQLTKDNLGFPIYDNLYSSWHNSHPPLLERIAALNDKKND